MEDRNNSPKGFSTSSVGSSFMSLPTDVNTTNRDAGATPKLHSDMARSHRNPPTQKKPKNDPINDKKATSSTDRRPYTRSQVKAVADPTTSSGCHATPSSTASTGISVNIPNSTVTLHLIQGDIVTMLSDAIVSIEDKWFDETGAITSLIWQHAPEAYRRKHSNLWSENRNAQITKVVSIQSFGGQLLCRYIFHTIAPRWGFSYTQDTSTFERDLNLTVTHILQKVADLTLQSVALPILGTSLDERIYPSPIPTCCKSMVQGLQGWVKGHSEASVREITLVCTDPAIYATFKDVIEQEVATRSQTGSGQLTSATPPTCAMCMKTGAVAGERWFTLNCQHTCHETCVNLGTAGSSIDCKFCKIIPVETV